MSDNDRDDVTSKAVEVRRYIYQRMLAGQGDKEDAKTLAKLDHHERRLDCIPDPPSTWSERVRFAWHAGWLETNHTIYLIKQEVEP